VARDFEIFLSAFAFKFDGMISLGFPYINLLTMNGDCLRHSGGI
jgi:hypothetical protein